MPSSLSLTWQAVSEHLLGHCSDAVIFTDRDYSVICLSQTAVSLMAKIKEGQKAEIVAQGLLDFFQTQGHLDDSYVEVSDITYQGQRLSLKAVHIDESTFGFILRDIGELIAQQEYLDKLKETNNELNEIIELSADGLVSVDHRGNILRLNKAYKKILGIKKEDFVGKPAQLLVEKGYLPELVSPKVLKRRKPVSIVAAVRDKEVLLTGRPVFNENGRVSRVVANIRNLTKLNKLRNQLKKYHDLANRYETEIKHLRAKEIENKIIGRSDGTAKMTALAAQASEVDSTVLIYGETGTGKELLVKSIHQLSKQKNGPFIDVNCSSIPESLIESELFGYEPGAFTGSDRKGRIGLFEAADGGTLFLDEISEMPLLMQAKLLRVLQDKSIRRIGAHKNRKLDVRIIAASNKKLDKCIQAGTFRADLYYRLNIIFIEMPPLRNRKEDIPLLVHHFLNEFNSKYGHQKHISKKEMLMLINYDWPGNIRELRNMMERFVVLDNALDIENQFKISYMSPGELSTQNNICLKTYLKQKEYEIISDTYNRLRSTRKTAAFLKVSQATIVRKLKDFNSGKSSHNKTGRIK